MAHSLTDSVVVPRDTPIKDGIASLDSVQIKENSFLPTAFTIIALRMRKQPRIIVQIPDCSPQRKQKKTQPLVKISDVQERPFTSSFELSPRLAPSLPQVSDARAVHPA